MTAEESKEQQQEGDGGSSGGKKEKKAPPANLVIPPKKPKLTKAERRALQEAQRAAKAAGDKPGGKFQPKQQQQHQQQHQQQQQQQHGKQGDQSKQQQQQQQQSNSNNSNNKKANAKKKQEGTTEDTNTLTLFSHLPQYRDPPTMTTLPNNLRNTLHPAVLELGIDYANGTIRGGNARCRAMLHTFLKVLDDYDPVDIDDYRSHLHQQVLKASFTYWTIHCRPHSVGMGNAFTFVKTAVMSLDRDMDYPQGKVLLQETIQQYINERLDFADQAITQHAMRKIQAGDVILTFGHSEVISILLEAALTKTKNFTVWVVDSRPLWEGKQTLKKIQSLGVKCGYINLDALTYVMKEVTKVFLGASALMTNGSIFGRVGTACVALLAKDNNIPVLVCCETYKISNRVQLESVTVNELGNPDALLEHPTNDNEALAGWKEIPNLKLLNLLYDVTPPEFVSGIVTELGIIPPTSIAVVLREMNPQDTV